MSDKKTQSVPVEAEAKSTTKPKKNRSFPWRWLITLLVLIFLFAAGYYFKKHHKTVVRKQQSTQAVGQLNQERLTHLYEHQQEIIATQNSLMQRLQQKGISVEPLAIEDALQILRHAQFELQATQNVSGALQLLQFAQTNLQRYNSIALNTIEQAVGADIQMLQAISVLNVTQTVGHLLPLQQQVQQLTLSAVPQVKAAVTPVVGENRFRAAWQQTVQALKQVVVVQRTATTMVPLLNQQQLVDYKLYVQGLLQQAVWGVLHKNQSVYQGALDQAVLMLQQHFPSSNVGAQNLLQALKPLQALNAQPAVPQKLTSIAVAEQVQQKLLASKVGEAT
jgi:uncharacterized protein HemX